MKLALITIIRNEQDILNTFINHVDALFDEVYFVDHRSLDNTASIIKLAMKRRNGWYYFASDMNAHYQKEVTNLLIQHAFIRQADFVFFLDCDEFIQVKHRAELEAITKGLFDSATGGSFRWINCVPDKLDRPTFKFSSTIWKSKEPSKFTKVCIPRSLYEQHQGKIFISQGNHQIVDSEGNFMDTLEIGFMLHLPVRSKNQFINKAIQSSLSHLSRTSRLPDESYQFFEMLKLIAQNDISDDTLRGCVYLYQKEAKIIPISKLGLHENWQKTSLRALQIASGNEFSFSYPQPGPHLIEQVVSDHVLSWTVENPNNLVLDENEGRIYIKVSPAL